MSEASRHRWRLLLGEAAEDALRSGPDGLAELSAQEQRMDRALAALYDAEEAGGRSRHGGLGSSAPTVSRWLGDIRRYFPTSVVQVMQRDAVDRLGLASLLLEPELLESVQPEVHLAATLIGLNAVMPETTRRTARLVVETVVAQIERRIAPATRTAVTGALNRAARTHRPRPADIDWNATIAANLAHYLPEYRTVVPQRLIGHARSSPTVTREVIVAIDQSGSMAESVVFAAVFGAVLASIRSLRTALVVFDAEVSDLTAELHDPVDLLFGCQLGGGTDLNRALAYCSGLVRRPEETVLLLISDLYEGGDPEQMLRRIAALRRAGVCVVVLLALSDSGAPAYDHELAAALAALNVPAFACTPDAFPELLATALSRGDVGGWHARRRAAASQA